MGYHEKLAALAASMNEGGVHLINVMHDDWCAIWKGGPCDCNPDVEVRKVVLEELKPPKKKRAKRK